MNSRILSNSKQLVQEHQNLNQKGDHTIVPILIILPKDMRPKSPYFGPENMSTTNNNKAYKLHTTKLSIPYSLRVRLHP